ncbi:MAG: LysM peptidoglycan-binding domain-containing protein [Actinomycetota bacterium]
MAVALSPQRQTSPAVSPIEPRPIPAGLRLSLECRTRRNQDVRSRYLAEVRARQRAVFVRRRIIASLVVITIAAAACLGVRARARRGDGAASLPTVTPNGSALLMTAVGTDLVLDNGVDLSGAFIRGEQVYVVQPGDTLWSIASSLTDGDIRSFVDELIDLNGTASVDVGQRLVLPAD